MNKYKNHPGISKIKMSIKSGETFFLQPVSSLEARNEIDPLNRLKKTNGELSTDVVKSTADNCHEYITYYINLMFAKSTFPNEIKLADVSPIFKGGDSTLKEKFRPISVLSAISKIFERLIPKQICLFAYRLLANILCAFREGHNAEHVLFRRTEICCKALADGRVMGMVLMDLSKAHDCISHDLLIAKLAAHGFGHCSLLRIRSYLSNRKHRVKVGSEFSEWLEIKSGVPQS